MAFKLPACITSHAAVHVKLQFQFLTHFSDSVCSTFQCSQHTFSAVSLASLCSHISVKPRSMFDHFTSRPAPFMQRAHLTATLKM